jgi:hypothetical protein
VHEVDLRLSEEEMVVQPMTIVPLAIGVKAAYDVRPINGGMVQRPRSA